MPKSFKEERLLEHSTGTAENTDEDLIREPIPSNLLASEIIKSDSLSANELLVFLSSLLMKIQKCL